MSEKIHTIGDAMEMLAEDARNLMSATSDVAGEKGGEARNRLAAAMERAKEISNTVRAKVFASVKATDEAVHEHPYQTIAIGVGVGILIGYVLARGCSTRNCD